MKIKFTLRNETKTCYLFEAGENPDQITLYLKKAMVDAEGINPHRGIVVTVEQDGSDQK